VCGKRFRERGKLKGHIETHTSEKHHKCKVCNKRFTREIYLKNHMKRHLAERQL